MSNYFCGVYKIVCSANNFLYIGSAKNSSIRWRDHLYNLKKNKHHCRHLQNAYNKYGKEFFTLEPLETCSKNQLEEREQYHMKQYPRKILFNSSLIAGRIELTPEIIKRISETQTQRMSNPKVRKHLSEINSGKKYSQETCEKKSKSLKLMWNSKDENWKKSRNQKLSDKMKGNTNGQGRKKSPEEIEKIRQKQLGKFVSLETRARLHFSHLGHKRSQESIEKQKATVARKKYQKQEAICQNLP